MGLVSSNSLSKVDLQQIRLTWTLTIKMEFNICKLKLLISRHDILMLFSYFISQVGSYVNNMPE